MTKEELEKLKQTVDYFGHWFDVIGEERIVILEKSIDYIDALEKDKCELLGIIQDKDKAIKELKERISILLSCKNCPENKGGYICEKEYENKCLAQKIQYIKELKEDNMVMADNYSKMEQKFYDNLTKAKNLLRELYVKARYSPFAMEEHKNILTEVLEFLQEE